MNKDRKTTIPRQEKACVVGSVVGSAVTVAITGGYLVGAGYSLTVPELVLSGLIGTVAGCAMGVSVEEEILSRRKR